MTREEFNAKIIKQFKEYEEEEMSKSKSQIFSDSYEIAKTIALKDYLTEVDDEDIECCYPYVDTIFDDLYFYEMDFNTVQWTDWGNISAMIDDLIEDKEAH